LKYIKLFEKIDWEEDWDFEEEDPTRLDSRFFISIYVAGDFLEMNIVEVPLVSERNRYLTTLYKKDTKDMKLPYNSKEFNPNNDIIKIDYQEIFVYISDKYPTKQQVLDKQDVITECVREIYRDGPRNYIFRIDDVNSDLI